MIMNDIKGDETYMPYYHLDKYDNLLKRKCVCGGNPQMILDIVQDYIVRCEKCHESTNAYMRLEGAVEAWDNNECTGPLDLLTDDLRKHLDNIRFLYVSVDELLEANNQGCECYGAIIDTGENLIYIEQNEYMQGGCIEFDKISGYNKEIHKYKVDLSQEAFKLDKIKYYENGFVEAIKYKCGDMFLFIVALKNSLRITMSKYNLFEEI